MYRSISQVCAKTRNIKIRPVVENLCVGTGPHWDHENKVLLFADIWGKKVHKYDPRTEEHKTVEFDDCVSFIIPVKCSQNKFVISTGRKLNLLTWDGFDFNVNRIINIRGKDEHEDIYTRLNDAKADPLGNLFFGSMKRENDNEIEGNVSIENRGEFYRFDSSGEIETILSPVSISNGITWNVDKTKMFYADSLTRRVDVFDYNNKTGRVTNRKVFFEFDNYVRGIPEGMTTDCNDNIWIACFCGSSVICVSSRSGIVLDVVNLPVERVTSVVFGGEDMNVMYVTSSQMGLTSEEKEEQPLAGSVFEVTGLEIRGIHSNSIVLPPDFNKIQIKPFKETKTKELNKSNCSEKEQACYVNAITGCKKKNPCPMFKPREPKPKKVKIKPKQASREECAVFKILRNQQNQRCKKDNATLIDRCKDQTSKTTNHRSIEDCTHDGYDCNIMFDKCQNDSIGSNAVIYQLKSETDKCNKRIEENDVCTNTMDKAKCSADEFTTRTQSNLNFTPTLNKSNYDVSNQFNKHNDEFCVMFDKHKCAGEDCKNRQGVNEEDILQSNKVNSSKKEGYDFDLINCSDKDTCRLNKDGKASKEECGFVLINDCDKDQYHLNKNAEELKKQCRFATNHCVKDKCQLDKSAQVSKEKCGFVLINDCDKDQCCLNKNAQDEKRIRVRDE